ncbi:hypothetical protein EPUS_02566 [Endocarpon pusillum Z07020]|uniref:LITAF domain-containing protein n=1 Tax=Endocarpon pusillum (strain Z07020 / HMAS-L-300199) TaxID=1263415 RepID=U1HKF0_ENDPU|nr:uncharacterized protein EPUS_02566 [Endocarpon pusillum Z07020]ERF70700.1 hypothetical protein EPUS_02566 [Endocarpon pusillum Z07020]
MQTPPLAHQGQQQPMMYQQQANGMNYQQQPGMMQHDPNQHQMHQQQQMYGQPPPQQYQGGPTSPPGQGQQMGGGGMAQNKNDGSQFKTATAIPNLGMGPAPVDCPSCGKRGMTRVSYQAGNTTHIWAGITFCFTLCLCFIPYLMNSLKDVQHHCSNCGVLLATWHKSGAVDVHMHG